MWLISPHPHGVLLNRLNFCNISALALTTMPTTNTTSSMLSEYSCSCSLHIFCWDFKFLMHSFKHLAVSSSSSTRLLGQPGSKLSSSSNRFSPQIFLNNTFYKTNFYSSNSSSLNHKSYFKTNFGWDSEGPSLFVLVLKAQFSDSVTRSASTLWKVCHRFLKTSPPSLTHDRTFSCGMIPI